ncbi:hypothetical protein [Roseimarinus sediminis]|uniref:hypothetical protein n=1 Tax=Roseimarinus sediminis TaxID=1610899 RepID=UPI003D23392C
MKGKQIKRKFNKSYDELTSQAQAVLPQFKADMELFSAFDPNLNQDYAAEFETELNAAMNDNSESAHTAEINLETEIIQTLRVQAGEKYQHLLYFVHKAIGDTKGINKTFGLHMYQKAVVREKVMIPLLTQAIAAIDTEDYRTQLLAGGMPESLPAELQQLSQDLVQHDNKQEMLKKQRLLVTEERIALFNSIWSKLKDLNRASKIIFKGNVVRQSIYRLYGPGKSSTEAAAG